MTEILVRTPTCFELNRTWDFGSHALLSQNDLLFLSSMLECRKCRLRHIYHSLAARELSMRSHDLIMGPIKPRLHFHQLSRLIKAILIATKKQRTLYRSGGSLCSFVPPISGLPPPRPPRVRRWICNNHATDVFRFMFYAADDNIFHLHLREVQASPPAKWVRVVFPEGQTEFFTKGLSEFEKASSVPRFRTSCTGSNLLLGNDFVPSFGLTLILGTEKFSGSSRGKLSKKDIEDANRRWNDGYKDLKPLKREEECRKRVSFPKYSPVTRIHHLITYGTAMRLLRKDRTWEFYCVDRTREGRTVEEEVEEEEAGATCAAADPVEGRSYNSNESDVEAKHLIEIVPMPPPLETIGDHAGVMDISRKKRRRKRRRRCNKGNEVSPSGNASSCSTSDLLQGASSSFCLDSSYLEKISSLLFKEVYSPPSPKPDTSSRVVDEFFL
ncbi:expressed conserved protein [Echinococcus multilocularis]|uniref:Expressed conserved protein n=1 Tax=Echinococcus multilocularis TaxID=6211 RepID=A0A087W267_ECHMU|nr:expressed conserved protein [Echinococcus multilocularis]